MRADITITKIPTIMGIMAMVITRPLDLATVTAEAIMAVIRLMGDIMAVVIEAVTAGAIMAAGLEEAFTEVIDKNGNIFKQN
jgi:hypothetical protein